MKYAKNIFVLRVKDAKNFQLGVDRFAAFPTWGHLIIEKGTSTMYTF